MKGSTMTDKRRVLELAKIAIEGLDYCHAITLNGNYPRDEWYEALCKIADFKNAYENLK